MSVTQPRFTAREKNLLLASRRAEKEPRGAHGFLLSESTDISNRGHYSVPDPVQDFAAEVLVNAQEAYRAMPDRPPMEALLWRVEKS